ncbi:trichohyalin [Drosophila persimilis]|uniref:trichohyalin n=1 Tax=Drosophila persimilis TaxID=7234 RepID=UPI000F09333E|nr:trichohyalin [Drosophila persimilis]
MHRSRFQVHPVVVSAKRYEAIQSRAQQKQKHAQLADVEEERRYRQYLKEGNDLLCSYFKGMVTHKAEEKSNVAVTPVVAAEPQESKQIEERLRKERILRANNILDQLKPGHRALHQALLESEMLHQRGFNEALNREIAEDARRQQEQDEIMCPEVLIPFTNITEEELAAKEEEKRQAVRLAIMQDVEAKRKLMAAEKEQRLFDEVVERAQYKCLQDKEEKAFKERKARSIEFNRKAYRDSLREKAEIEEHERICDVIDDRRNCVYQVATRQLDGRYNAHIKETRAKKQREREERAVRVCRLQQAGKKKLEERQATLEDRYEFETQVDEARRQCELEELAKQRKAYQLVEKQEAEEKLKRERELQRFEVARRLKNAEANRHFEISEKRNRDKVTAEVRDTLHRQREEFLEQRQQELMRISACDDDPYLLEDKKFYAQAVEVMEQSRKLGRPLYPIATAVERYARSNNLDVQPDRGIVKRSKLRDYCWPGYHAQADLAYRKYDQAEMCRENQRDARNQIYCNAVKIKKMASVEKPYKPCVPSCPINCFHRRGMPAVDSTDSFDYGPHVCYEESPPLGACPSRMQGIRRYSKDPSLPNLVAPPPMPELRLDATAVPSVAKMTNAPPSAPTVESAVVAKPSRPEPPGGAAPAAPPKVPGAGNRRESLPQSRPPVSVKTRRGSAQGPSHRGSILGTEARGATLGMPKTGAQALTGQNRPAAIPNPTGTWGAGPLPQPPPPPNQKGSGNKKSR